jgi:VWFA-related protein
MIAMNRPLILAACLLAMATAVPSAQQAVPNTDRPKFGTSTAAVVVDVIVRDKKGNPVVDLTRNDFEVFENGTVQKVIDFERVLPGTAAPQVAGAAPAEAAAALVPAGVTAAAESTLQGQAVTAIVFDWLTDQSRYEAWKAASTLLGQMEPNDYAAVFVIDQALRRLVPYTRDTRLLKAGFDNAVIRPSRTSTRPDGALVNGLVRQRDLPNTPGAESAAGANTAITTPTDNDEGTISSQQRGPEATMARMLEQQMRWETYMNRQQQGFAVSNALLALVEQLSGMPGRKTVVLFSEGFEVPDNVREKFNEVEDRANRHNVTFYTMDAAGLRVQSRMPMIASAIGEAGIQNVATGIASDPSGDRTEMMWRDPTAGLEPLARHTGGLYIGDTNNLRDGFAKITADRRFHYLLAYASSNPALDGTYRKIDVRVRRPDVKIRARGGYVASPSVEQTSRGDYETAAVKVLSTSPSAAAFPFQLRAISTPLDGRPGLTSLVAAVDTKVMTFRQNTADHTYEGDVTVLARVMSKDGEALATQSQVYQMHGDLTKVDAARDGRLLFFRTPEVPPGAHTVEWVVRDGNSGEASVLRSAMDVPLPDVRPVVGDLVIVDHAEKAPQDDPAMKRHPLVWNGLLLYPSLGLPISKGERNELTFFLPMLVDSGEPPPSTRMELLHAGRSLGTIDVPTAKADNDSLRQVGQLPIDKLPPGVYELKATITAGDRRVSRTAAFTLVP